MMTRIEIVHFQWKKSKKLIFKSKAEISFCVTSVFRFHSRSMEEELLNLNISFDMSNSINANGKNTSCLFDEK